MLKSVGETELSTGTTVQNMLRRSGITAKMLKDTLGLFKGFNDEVLNEITIQTKYEGYIAKEQVQIDDAKRQEKIILPQNFDYNQIAGLRLEAREKLSKIQPLNMGQASRISGVSPADIAVLTVYLKSHKML